MMPSRLSSTKKISVFDDGFFASFGHDSEIIQILKKLFLLADRKNDRSAITTLVGEILQ
jgi:hypothetical protein